MAFTPSNRVYLLDTPLDNTYKNQLRFSSKEAQANYFLSCNKSAVEDIDYIKHENALCIEGELDDYWKYNYVMYQNSDNNSKWFYAFITKMEWESARSFKVYIETDVYQTWLFDTEILPSFVEREHVNDDTLGKHLVDEGLEYGEYIFKEYQKSNLFNEIAFVVAVSDLSPFIPESLKASARIYDNLVSGLVYWVFRSDSVSNMTSFLLAYDTAGRSDAVEMIFTIPWAFLPNDGQLMSDIDSNDLSWNYTTTHTLIDGYLPENNKLFTYPYNVLAISNNNGNSATFRFEDFLNPEDILFKIESHIGPSPVVICSPRNYKKHTDFNSQVQEYGITLDNFPLCSWKSDVFRNWVAQNSLSVLGGTVGGLGAVIGGVASGNPGVAVGGIYAVYSQLTQTYKASIQPDQAKGNTKNGSFNIAHNRQDFYLMHLTIKGEYARIIDNFLSMYGYKVNTVKVPETHSRQYWNYIKTTDINITGSIPADDMRKLKGIYNSGVTLWHNPERFCNYSYHNNIL
jgi:hypothetical protein